MNLKEKCDIFLKEHPSADLNLITVEKILPGLYQRYKQAISAISSAVVVDDEPLYNKALNEYLTVHNEFCERGLCFSEAARKAKEEKIGQVRSRIEYLRLDIQSKKSTIKSFKDTLTDAEKQLEDRETELAAENKKLDEMEGRV